MSRLKLEAQRLHLERERDRQDGSKTAWWADIAGGSARAGGGGRGSQRSQIHPMPPEMYKNGKKRAVLCTFWLINCQKCCFSLKSTEQDILRRHFLRNTVH
jgi:hypothetical protein